MEITKFTDAVSREDDEGFNGFRTAVNDQQIEQRADELNDQANQEPPLYLALALVAIVVALLVTWLVSRSITRPLRSLTRQAKEMAERRLPEAVIDILDTPLGDDVTVPTVDPVRVNTRDEVADVADALNTVQDSALDLAVEQAVLRRNIADSFVNLGRRNQNLLGRQLDFITELETNETDADTLANLFRLDHLATRMRRNAESLLVLAGIDPPRQWAAPVRLTDVIRAALGEVEDYQRVTVRGVEPATIIGSAAADLAHLLAELIENALVFSPPDQTVDIRGRNRPGRLHARHHRLGPRHAAPPTWPPPTGALPAPNRSPSPRRSTWATTSPATSPPATASASTWTTRRATASPPPSTPADAADVGCAARRPGAAAPVAPAVGPRLKRAAPPRRRCAAARAAAGAASPWAALDLPPPLCRRPPCRPRPARRAAGSRPAPPAAWSSGPGGPASPTPRRPPSPTATCWPACRTSPATCPAPRRPRAADAAARPVAAGAAVVGAQPAAPAACRCPSGRPLPPPPASPPAGWRGRMDGSRPSCCHPGTPPARGGDPGSGGQRRADWPAACGARSCPPPSR